MKGNVSKRSRFFSVEVSGPSNISKKKRPLYEPKRRTIESKQSVQSCVTLGDKQGVIRKQSIQACFEKNRATGTHWMYRQLQVWVREQILVQGSGKVFGQRVRKVFAFRFVAAYVMFDTLKKCIK